MATKELRFTRADYDRLPEELRAELVDGRLLKMASPGVTHQRIVGRIYAALVAVAGEDRVLVGPVDFRIDEGNVLVPDVVVPEGEAAGDRGVSAARLVVEVLSPSTATRDRRTKAAKYLAAGVGEVWLVDPVKGSVEVLRQGGGRSVRTRSAAQSRSLPGFRLVPAELFATPSSRRR